MAESDHDGTRGVDVVICWFNKELELERNVIRGVKKGGKKGGVRCRRGGSARSSACGR